MAHAPRVVLGLACAIALGGCLPADRQNAACAWHEPGGAIGAAGTHPRRAHLTTDARLAVDLGIRHADAVIGTPPSSMRAWRAVAYDCTDRALRAAARHHAADRVTPAAELGALVGARDWWFDLFAVFVPAGALLVAVGRSVARRVAAGADGDWRLAALLLTGLTPVAAGLAVGLTQMWGWTAETSRLRNGHISYRAFELPASRHGWLVAVAAAVVFAVVAGREVRRLRRAAREVPATEARRPVGGVSLGIGRRRN